MESNINLEDRKENSILIWIGMGVIVMTFIYFFAITFINIPINNQKYSDLIIGYVSGVVSAIVGFYWGGAHGGPRPIDSSKLREQAVISEQEQIVGNGVDNIDNNGIVGQDDNFYYEEDEMAPPLKG